MAWKKVICQYPSPEQDCRLIVFTRGLKQKIKSCIARKNRQLVFIWLKWQIFFLNQAVKLAGAGLFKHIFGCQRASSDLTRGFVA